MSLYIYHVGANVETVANLGHKAEDFTTKSASKHWCYSENQWPHFWLLQSMILFSFFLSFFGLHFSGS